MNGDALLPPGYQHQIKQNEEEEAVPQKKNTGKKKNEMGKFTRRMNPTDTCER